MKRRHFLAGAGALAGGRSLGQPALAQPAVGGQARKLVFVPTTNPPSYDPVWTTAQATRNVAAMIYETLYGRDKALNAHPQMVDGHLVEDGGKRWTMKLRDGLRFHDGTPVLARDCVASVKRWMVRDAIGATITARLDALEATDDKTMVWRLNKPFAFLPNALAKTQSTCVIMPERLAGDPFKQAAEAIGSGPYRWVADEFISGSRAVFARNDAYVPRPEPVDFASGGYHANFDRVEWRVIPDAATAAAALATGEVDWIDVPLPDLLPMLRRAPGVTVGRLDTHGIFPALRPNFLQGPTANAVVRRAMLAAIDQTDMMIAVMGEDRSGWRAPVGFFVPGTESASEVGMEAVRNRPGPDAIKAMLKAGGYNGERIAFMHPTDPAAYSAMCQVAIAAFRRIGLNIDEQVTDWSTVSQRRNSKEPLDKGGWSLFPSGFPAVDYGNPMLAGSMRGNGTAAWVGWPDSPKLEALRDAWIDSTDRAEQKRISEQLQQECFNFVPYIPLGQYLPSSAWRSNIAGLLAGPMPVFWNARRV
ncbi:MAG: ABC transporter substrate-binding protein [Acetobacteraceae bacterium]|nr:ABC transporter substrate-binding protein [Acetobacteraceae bacterium]